MAVLLKNNAISRLAASLAAGATSLSVTAGDGVKFPSPAAGDWFPLTVIKSDGALEIMRCTGRSGDVLTIVRAQEGTASTAFSAGDRAELRFTAGTFNSLMRVAEGYIDGLIPVWNSPTSISVTSGTAYIPGSSGNLVSPSELTLSGLSLAASTWYYLYLYDNAGSPAIELVTTAPAAPYSGKARTKAGDTSRRFICALKTGSSGLFAFLWMGDTIQFMETFSDPPFRVVLQAPASTPTTSDLSPAVPFTTQIALVIATANAAAAAYDMYFSTPDRQPKVLQVASGGTASMRTPLRLATSPTQQISRWVSGGSLTLDVYGYGNER